MSKHTGKTAIVTGGTDGVGLSIVRALLKEDFSVYFIGSNREKGERVQADLHTDFGANASAQFMQADLSDMKAVKALADSLLEKLDRLDVLLFSAGVVLPKRKETVDGFELTFAVNYLSAYVLAKYLSPLLEKTDHARVLTVSGGAPLVLKERLDMDDLHLQKSYNGFKAAANAVHAKVVLSQLLAGQFEGKSVDSNTFHPGVVKSGLTRNLPWPLSLAGKTASQLMPRECKSGKRACLDESLTGVSGHFLYNNTRIPLKFSAAYTSALKEKTEAMLAGLL